MEDAHAFVYNFGGVHGQGYFSIFDGHAGKHAAEWCGQHFHEYLIDAIVANGATQAVPDLLNSTFHSVDKTLEQLASKQGTSSGCTAVACFLRLEDDNGKPLAHPSTGGINKTFSTQTSGAAGAAIDAGESQEGQSSAATPEAASEQRTPSSPSKSGGGGGGGGLLSSFAKSIRKVSIDRDVGQNATKSSASEQGEGIPAVYSSSSSSSPPWASQSPAAEELSNSRGSAQQLASTSSSISGDGLARVSAERPRRVLYTANVGDARAVLCRKGHAVRLTYDHKASDAQEAKRITDAGGFVMNNRVDAVLAVTRSLGDSAMKEFVVGAPYTTETTLTDQDTFLIVACDGLWDVTDDQDAVDLVANVQNPQDAAQMLLQHALSNFSTDNTSIMVVRFNADVSTPAGRVEAEQTPAGAKGQRNAVGDSDITSSGETSTTSDRDGSLPAVAAPPLASSDVTESVGAFQ